MKDRIGIDFGRKIRLEDGIAWAACNDVRFIDCEVDVAPNALLSFDETRAALIRETLSRTGVCLGLHTLSAVNIAEYSPFVSEAVDNYLKAYIDAAKRLDAGWVVVHAGYHFTADYGMRQEAALERLKRIVDYAERHECKLLLENTNKEPVDAEVHYFCFNLDECRLFFERIQSPWLGWSFTVNHAHMVPEGIEGTIDGLGLDRCGEVRLADNRGDKEEHLFPGEGTIDFRRLFRRIEDAGFRGHYMLAFGSLEDMLRGRDLLSEIAT